jgi:SAM-dependent methyltransferase
MKCFLCGTDVELFLDLGKQPLANKYPREAEFSKEEFFPLEVYFCPACKNVQLGVTVSRARMFEDYYYLSSVNPGLVRHFEALAEKLKGARFVVDVGSNDGILLKPLKERGVKALGVDPSVNVSKIANDAGLPTLTSFFDTATVERIRGMEYGVPDVIVASSIFTHVEDPHQFLDDVSALLADDGRCIIEVEYLGNIIADTQFERFYLDRVFYYSLTSLQKLFELHGMHLADVEMIEPHGGSIRVTAKKGKGSGSSRVMEMLKKEQESLTKKALQAFKEKVDAGIKAFRGVLTQFKHDGLRVAGYGAPARVATITNYGHIGPELIEYIVDDSPLKQGRYSPGTHIPITANTHLKEHRPDMFVAFAYEYLDDIKKKTGGGYRYLIPIPPQEVS